MALNIRKPTPPAAPPTLDSFPDYANAYDKRSSLRAQLRTLDAEIVAVQTAEWEAMTAGGKKRADVAIDAAADKIADAGLMNGQLEDVENEDLARLHKKRHVLNLAYSKSSAKFDGIAARRQSEVAECFVPQFRAVIARRAKAVVELAVSHRLEREMRSALQQGGISMTPVSLPFLEFGGVGCVEDFGSPTATWLRYVAEAGWVDQADLDTMLAEASSR